MLVRRSKEAHLVNMGSDLRKYKLDTRKDQTCNSQFFLIHIQKWSNITLDMAIAPFTRLIKLEGKSGTPCPTDSCRTIRSNAIWPKTSVSKESCSCKIFFEEKVAILTAETCMHCNSPVPFTLARAKKTIHMT